MGENKKEQQQPAAKGGAEKKGGAPKANTPKAAPDANKCKFTECKKGPAKFGFCADHYEMYMAGVIRGDGAKPIDFEQKMKWFEGQRAQRKAA